MKTTPLFAAALFLQIASISSAADLTIGEQRFQEAAGRDCPVIRLWPEGAIPDEPAAIGEETFATTNRGRDGLLVIRNVSDPSLTILTPPKELNTGAALVLCPGGGYGGLFCETVLETTRWMNERGVTVALLKYRVPKRHHEFAVNHQPVQDAQRALGILRARAAEWNIDPHRIGIGGFSAGGHLAASLAINHDERWYEAVDEFDATSCRPDFAVLLYPAYLTDPIESHELNANLNCERISKTATPPTLIGITRPDKFTIGAVEFYLGLMAADVPSELHVYPVGGHGGAIEKYPFGEWAGECLRFLGDQGIIDAPSPPEPLTYLAGSIEETPPAPGLTIGDQRLRQVLQRDCPVIPVWPGGVGPDETLAADPEVVTARSRGGNALNIRNVTRPTLTLVQPPPDRRNGRAMIVCPGGAYQGLAAEHEGTRVCQWLNELGITAILLKYRVPNRGGGFARHHHALQDLQRAMRIVRANAEAWNIDPDDLGVCGFSAGGNLCAVLCTNFETSAYDPLDEIDQLSCRPDFAVLVYPAYLVDPIDSNNVDPLVQHVFRNQTPPLFMASARDDRFTRGMLDWFLDVRAAKVPAECHVYAAGGHGGGIDPISYPTSEWTAACERWLNDLDR